MTEDRVRRLLRIAVQDAGSQAEFARVAHMHRQAVNQTLLGGPIPEKVLIHLGLKMVPTYERIDGGKL